MQTFFVGKKECFLRCVGLILYKRGDRSCANYLLKYTVYTWLCVVPPVCLFDPVLRAKTYGMLRRNHQCLMQLNPSVLVFDNALLKYWMKTITCWMIQYYLLSLFTYLSRSITGTIDWKNKLMKNTGYLIIQLSVIATNCEIKMRNGWKLYGKMLVLCVWVVSLWKGEFKRRAFLLLSDVGSSRSVKSGTGMCSIR